MLLSDQILIGWTITSVTFIRKNAFHHERSRTNPLSSETGNEKPQLPACPISMETAGWDLFTEHSLNVSAQLIVKISCPQLQHFKDLRVNICEN